MVVFQCFYFIRIVRNKVTNMRISILWSKFSLQTYNNKKWHLNIIVDFIYQFCSNPQNKLNNFIMWETGQWNKIMRMQPISSFVARHSALGARYKRLSLWNGNFTFIVLTSGINLFLSFPCHREDPGEIPVTQLTEG